MNIGFVGLGAMGAGIVPRLMPAATNGSAFFLLRFQPVTAWPAAMSRGTMPAPMAPRPTKPMFMPSPRNVRQCRRSRPLPSRSRIYPTSADLSAEFGQARVRVERAAQFCKIKERVRGFGCVSTIGNPLTPALSPNGERERTGFAARSRAIAHIRV